jgi:DNA transformation protein and related proteins
LVVVEHHGAIIRPRRRARSPFSDIDIVARIPDFVTHVMELLRELGAVTPKPMFGCWGLYRDDVFFAIVRNDMLYLKVDEANRADFESRGLAPFIYETKTGDSIVLDYREAPEEALEQPGEMARWARSAYAAALRKRAAKPPPRKRAKRAAPKQA